MVFITHKVNLGMVGSYCAIPTFRSCPKMAPWLIGWCVSEGSNKYTNHQPLYFVGGQLVECWGDKTSLCDNGITNGMGVCVCVSLSNGGPKVYWSCLMGNRWINDVKLYQIVGKRQKMGNEPNWCIIWIYLGILDQYGDKPSRNRGFEMVVGTCFGSVAKAFPLAM